MEIDTEEDLLLVFCATLALKGANCFVDEVMEKYLYQYCCDPKYDVLFKNILVDNKHKKVSLENGLYTLCTVGTLSRFDSREGYKTVIPFSKSEANLVLQIYDDSCKELVSEIVSGIYVRGSQKKKVIKINCV